MHQRRAEVEVQRTPRFDDGKLAGADVAITGT